MNKKTKYYLVGFIALCLFILGYHFFAASQAEQQIDEALQEQSAKDESLSIQYSEIDVSPFSAIVSIRDLNVNFGDHIERTQHLQLDMSYLDFLNIYIGGLPYGLKRLDNVVIQAIQPSYINRDGFEELKIDTLDIFYSGNALDGLESAINGTPFTSSHSIEAQSSNLRIALPETAVSRLTAETFNYSGSISNEQQSFWTDGEHHFSLDSLLWTPSQPLQEQYSFIINGFGYDADAIPFESAELNSQSSSQDHMLEVNSSIKSELALLSASGLIELAEPVSNSRFHEMELTLDEFSDSFGTVLGNFERLLGISISKQEGSITLQLEGTISDPAIRQ